MSVFKDCWVQKDLRGRWCLMSRFWTFPCEDERTAHRLNEVIRGAYQAGADDLRGQLAELILPTMKDGTV